MQLPWPDNSFHRFIIHSYLRTDFPITPRTSNKHDAIIILQKFDAIRLFFRSKLLPPATTSSSSRGWPRNWRFFLHFYNMHNMDEFR